MIIQTPDPDPGRCKNHRQQEQQNGAPPRMARCLDYDDVEHICRFPEPVKHDRRDWGSFSIPKPEPRPWVAR